MNKIAQVLKALRSNKLYKFGVRCVNKGLVSRRDIEKHDETRKVVGLPPLGVKKKDEGELKTGGGKDETHVVRPHVVKRGGKLL